MRALRRSVPFEPRLVERHPLLWPLGRAAAPFAGARDWPPVAAWTEAFGCASPPVRFVVAPPCPRRRRRPPDLEQLYDASIVRRGVVPSRPRLWHDYLNALVWATFPRAKAALHARQYAALAQRIEPASSRLPEHRTRELDALAMLDEGGVILLTAPTGQLHLIFGHAIYEGLVLGGPQMTARLVEIALPALDAEALGRADAALARLLGDGARVTDPAELPRIFVPEGAEPSWLRAAAEPMDDPEPPS
jgi:hypothetical protein